jgi:hypothetical protein
MLITARWQDGYSLSQRAERAPHRECIHARRQAAGAKPEFPANAADRRKTSAISGKDFRGIPLTIGQPYQIGGISSVVQAHAYGRQARPVFDIRIRIPFVNPYIIDDQTVRKYGCIVGITIKGASYRQVQDEIIGPRVDWNTLMLRARRCPRRSWKASFSAMKKGPLPARLASNRDGSNWPRAGTLFLDEICDTPPSMQAKLLRVLQDKKFERIGGSQTLAADVRIICATNKNIKDEVNAGREKTLEELEKERILAVLARNRWNQSKAAEVLVIHRNTLREKIKKFNLKLPLESK